MTTNKKSPRRPDFEVLHFDGEYATKIGAAWNSDSGIAINIKLELMPLDGRLTLAKPRPKPSKPTAK